MLMQQGAPLLVPPLDPPLDPTVIPSSDASPAVTWLPPQAATITDPPATIISRHRVSHPMGTH
jgi:hypothetical protein